MARRVLLIALSHVSQVKAALHISTDTIKAQVARFHEMDKSGDGLLSVEEFEKGLGFDEPNEIVRHMFHLLDVKDTGACLRILFGCEF
jgi:Ca2+-binding EF-hand superfamily protein